MDAAALEAIWTDLSATLPTEQSAEQYAAADKVVAAYEPDIQLLAATVKALYYGAHLMAEAHGEHTTAEYYQACIAVLIHEGVDSDKLVKAAEMLQAVERAIREAQ